MRQSSLSATGWSPVRQRGDAGNADADVAAAGGWRRLRRLQCTSTGNNGTTDKH